METLFKTIIKDAIILKATDIHFIPVKEDRVKVQLRISGRTRFMIVILITLYITVY